MFRADKMKLNPLLTKNAREKLNKVTASYRPGYMKDICCVAAIIIKSARSIDLLEGIWKTFDNELEGFYKKCDAAGSAVEALLRQKTLDKIAVAEDKLLKQMVNVLSTIRNSVRIMIRPIYLLKKQELEKASRR